MKLFFRRLGAFVEESLGLNLLGKDFKKFSLMHCMFNLFQGLVSVYIATLLMRVSGDGDIVRWYNLILYFFTGLMMPVAVMVMRKCNTNLVTRIGILGFIALYSSLLLGMNYADKIMPLLGMIAGIANAFYWITYSTYVTAFTEDSQRDVAMAFVGFINGIITLTMPALSGFVIEQIGGFMGYMVAFGLAFAVAVVTILLSLRLPKHVVPAEVKQRTTHYKQALHDIFHDACWRSGMLAEGMRGVREGTFNFLLNILLFEAIRSETLTGVNTLLTGLATIVSFWVIGRIVKPDNRVRVMLVGTIILLVASVLPAFSLSPTSLIVYSTINAFFTQFVINSSNTTFFMLVQKKSTLSMREEFFSIREVMLAIGRVLGIVVLFLFPKVQIGYVIAIIVLTLTQFLTTGLCKRATRLLKEEEERSVGESVEA